MNGFPDGVTTVRIQPDTEEHFEDIVREIAQDQGLAFQPGAGDSRPGIRKGLPRGIDEAQHKNLINAQHETLTAGHRIRRVWHH